MDWSKARPTMTCSLVKINPEDLIRDLVNIGTEILSNVVPATEISIVSVDWVSFDFLAAEIAFLLEQM
jgi:hypothetical protein